MGTFSSWSYTAKVTVWEPTLDAYGQPSAYARTTYNCSFRAGGDLRLDDRGEQFVPRTTLFLEAEVGSQPKVGSFIQLADSQEASPPEGAEVVRIVTRHDPSLFGEGTPDWEIATG